MRDIVVPDGSPAVFAALVKMKREVALVAVLVVTAVLVVLLASSRKAPARIAPPATSDPATAAPALFVHVAGAVRSPGLYQLPQGDRVADAIEAAGGALHRADLDALNLAQPLGDGMKVEVLRRGEASATLTSEVGGPATSVVSVNSASPEDLETVPGIGPVKAAAIVGYRDENGPFSSIEELLDVSGIGPATLEAIRSYVSL